jgi:hypothetical protein
VEMVERFLLDGIDGQRTGFSIDLADEHAVMVSATTTAACPTVSDTAVVRTEQALHHTIVQPLIIPTLHFNEHELLESHEFFTLSIFNLQFSIY